MKIINFDGAEIDITHGSDKQGSHCWVDVHKIRQSINADFLYAWKEDKIEDGHFLNGRNLEDGKTITVVRLYLSNGTAGINNINFLGTLTEFESLLRAQH